MGVSALAMAAAACDSRGVPTAPSRAGAERAVPAASGLAATTPGRQYDNDARAVDETRTAAFGSIVAGRGGQKAQQEAAAKEAAERDGRARDVAQREAAQRDAAKGTTPPPSARATVSPPPAPVVTTAPVTPAPAPIPAAPISAPAPAPAPAVEQATAVPAPAPLPVATAVATRPADPNKAFEPPPGWVPPGQAAPVQTGTVVMPAAEPKPAPIPAPVPAPVAAAPLPPAPAPAPAPVVTTAAIAPPVAAPSAAPPPSATLAPVVTPPIRGADIMMGSPTASAPPPPMASQRAPERAPNPTPAPMPAAAAPIPAPAPAPVAAMPPAQPAPASIPMPQPVAEPAITAANIAAAQSGSVPASALTSPPLGGPMQVAVIQFGRNSAGLSANDIDVLTRVAQIQRRNGGTVRVLGHAQKDVVGSSVAEIKNGNLNLSIKRAESVAQLLVRNGVPASAIVMEGVSDEEPVYETKTARGIAANRRAEVFIDF